MSNVLSSVGSVVVRSLLGAFLVFGIAQALVAEEAAPAWVVPAGWTKLEAEKPMRVATYSAGEGANKVEVAISVFPGDVGGLLGNVNRWRRQVGLDALTQEQLAANVQSFENPGFNGSTMRLKGESQHMLGAAIKDVKGERTWFVKIQGVPAAIDAQEAAFLAFAKSFAASKTAEK